MFEDFINALNNFKTNKMRTTLSLLGIIIGVTSVVIITTLGNSLQRSMEDEFKNYSLKVLTIGSSWDRKTRKPAINFDDDFRKDVLEKIPEIKNMFFNQQININISRKNIKADNKTLEWAEPHQLEDLELKLDYGNFFEATDYIIGANKAIIGHALALDLFPEGNAIGKTIDLQISAGGIKSIYPVKITGVLKNTMTWFMQSAQSVFIPRKTYSKIYNHKNLEIYRGEIIAHDENKVPIIKAKLEKYAKDLKPNMYKPIWINSAKSQLDQVNNMLSMVRLVIVSIAGISLLVGGIGIMNIMLVTVTERRKEIGIRKALGATNFAIKLQFLVESATLTLTGGIVGVILGMLISKLLIDKLIPPSMPLKFFFDIKGTIIAFGVSVFIGVFFGLHPAAKAAKLDPVVALGD